MKIATGFIFVFVQAIAFAQINHTGTQCFTNQTVIHRSAAVPKSINDPKYLRVSYHFMQMDDGSGSFTETDDGNGVPYSGYDVARDMINWMNTHTSGNVSQNIPTGNTVSVINKNYYYLLDGVHFHPSSANYTFGSGNISVADFYNFGANQDSVIHIFLTQFPTGSGNIGGYASSLSATSKIKYTEIMGVWQWFQNEYAATGDYAAIWLHGATATQYHEIGHLLGLSHTILWNSGTLCPSGCPTPINIGCDDGCADTPTAWDIHQANGCTQHPHGGWGSGSNIDCSNNLMDYSGDWALSPCQINIIHNSIEVINGMKSYVHCAVLKNNKTYCDVGYPQVTYYGKNVTMGCGTPIHIVDRELLGVYFSESVDLGYMDIDKKAEIEFFLAEECNF